jgi:uncharacterized protein YprB with RNaseH-like and TPR domain
MLRHTFCHIPGIAAKTERRLWDTGVTCWEDALRETARGRIDATYLRDSLVHYRGRNSSWFARLLPAAQSWRLFHDFRGSCAFLDIETTGMPHSGHITTIALYDGRTIRHYVHGHNLPDFLRDVRDYRLLVTYNGKSFDVPFIERTFNVRIGLAHIDLCHVLRSLGLRGGLKSCERQLGLSRPGMEDVDGYVAVLLWYDYSHRSNARALESLLAYNIQDTINLEALMVHALNRKLDALTGVAFAKGYRLEVPPAPANPFRVDAPTVSQLLREFPLPRMS